MSVPTVEFWPDYGAGPLWLDGRSVDPADLGVSPDLSERLRGWNGDYAEDRMPLDGEGDAAYLRAGAELLGQVRTDLAGRYVVVVTESWWDEPPHPT